MLNKTSSVGYISPAGISRAADSTNSKYALYKNEKEIIRDEFKSLGKNFDWTDPNVAGKLKEFARQVIKRTGQTIHGPGDAGQDLTSLCLPTETIEPGDTFILRELHGVNIYYGSYGAAVRMSRPQFTQYTQTTNVKEVGLKLELSQIRSGKYSPSELAAYTSSLITAWRNRLLFVTTLAGMTAYQSGGDQYQAGTALAFGTMNAAINKLTDEAEIKLIVGRRQAIHSLSNMSGWGETGIDQFQAAGQVGKYAGIPVHKVNSFTDPDYGTLYPMPEDELWVFSDLPAGRMVIADSLRTADETLLQTETMNIYFRWDDGIGIFYPNRIVRVAAVT